jgi:hypothetical protein
MKIVLQKNRQSTLRLDEDLFMNMAKNKSLANSKFSDSDRGRGDFHNVRTVVVHAEGNALYTLGNECVLLHRVKEPVFDLWH